MENMFVFDNVVAHLINESSRTPVDDAIDECIERLVVRAKLNKDFSESEDYLHNLIGAAINQQFIAGFKAGIQFMTVAVAE